MKKILCIVLSAAMLLGATGCGMSNTGKGAIIGGGGGAALGAAVGAIFGKGKGAAIGAAVGAAVGTGAGVLIGKKMDKQKAELERIAGAQVDTITDANNLTAIKVTFDNGILFATGKSALSAAAKNSLSQFATSLINNPQTNVQICGHTDNTGSRAVNERLSKERANAVLTYLNNSGVPVNRMTSEGYAYDYPVASNNTEAGRAQNRRVEVYISANEDMINAANNGTLK
ncbi:OmpA family protein [Sodaliphilus sp.]|uniref:OmpA family protein n=1 Tax=Sodaliphilus sp. TaxID=2815818 RepID=UPI00388E8A00